MGTLRRVFPLLAAATLVATGCGYNTIQTKDEAVNSAASQIKTQLQRRADLIPNLVETVKGFARQESTIFISVAEARSRLSGAVQGGNLQEMGQANQALTSSLGRLLAIVENYPELKSNQNFLQLQDQLEGTENRISVARNDYNQAVQDFNAYIRRFPYNLTAKVFGMGKPREYFELTTPGAAEAPKVKF
jgi:LemA protein